MIETRFKKTEIGVIPEDWVLKSIASIASIFGRIGYRGYTVYDLVKEGFGAITLSPTNIRDNRMVFDKCTYISWEKYEESPEIKIQNGDILMVKTGSTGKSAFVENLPCAATINPQFVVFKNIKCNSRLLALLIMQQSFQQQINSITSGGAIPTMSQAKILTCKLSLPASCDEQNRIAAAFSDIDALISDLEALIEKKQNIKQGVMQELLSGKRRLTGFTGEWKKKPFFEVLYSCNNKSKQIDQNQYLESGITPIVDQGKQLIGGYTDKVDPIKKETGPYIVFGDHTCFFKYIDFDFYLGADGTQLLKCHKDYNTAYINHACQMIALPNTGYDRHFKYLRDVVFFLPSLKAEQNSIAKVLITMDSEINTLQARLNKYKQLKQGMMQQLLTGRIRLK